MTETQKRQQCDGPFRPQATDLAVAIIKYVPPHFEIRAISINGQAGFIEIECYHDEAVFNYELRFDGIRIFKYNPVAP